MDEEGKWITIHGRHVFIKEGQTISDAIAEYDAKKRTDDYKGNTSEINGKLVYQLDSGEIISTLDTKEYKKISNDFADSLTDDEKAAIRSYVDTPFYGGSAELNTLTEENLKTDRTTKYVINYDKNNVMTENEVRVYKKEAIEDWNKNYTEKNYAEESEWKKKWGLTSPRFIEEKDYKVYSKDEVDAAKKAYILLDNIENKRRYETYGSDKYIELANEHKKVQSDSGLVDENQSGRSSYYFKQIAEVNDTLVINPKIDLDKALADSTFKYVNIKEALSTKYDDSIQLTRTKKQLETIKREQVIFDNLFKEKGVKLDKDILVFRRGRESDEEVRKGFIKHGYISTSVTDKLPKKMPSGEHFGDKAYYIIVPKGTNVLFAENVIGYRDKTDEDREISKGVMKQKEIILPRNMKYSNMKYDYNRRAYVLKAEEVDIND